jgi:excisionase family DNA binding protein
MPRTASKPQELQDDAPYSVTITVACRLSGLGRSTIYDLALTGKIPSIKHGKRRLIVLAPFIEYLKSHIEKRELTTIYARRKEQKTKAAEMEAA